MSLPLVLAGPIVRRVEPRLASVWVALSAPSSFQLDLFDLRSASLNTLRVVRQKHIVSFLTYYMGNVNDDDDGPQQSNQLPFAHWCHLKLTKDLTYPLGNRDLIWRAT
jgi:hypothetical protein